MKYILSVLVLCLGLALMTATPIRAQLPGTTIRANIPFDFNVRGKTLPAGSYQVSRISDELGGLHIYSRSNHQNVLFETDAVETRTRTPHRAELVFHRYGDTYFLYEIWTPGENTGRELPTSRAERRLEQESAKTNTKPEMVALAVE